MRKLKKRDLVLVLVHDVRKKRREEGSGQVQKDRDQIIPQNKTGVGKEKRRGVYAVMEVGSEREMHGRITLFI
ncbi:hypothetical protein RIF29_32365 [Crotalaria pallida]|uniref:Uncharacterized protein n=1 Tax=Crotalaria pallida TaxID=3830 RepID=A0AAN9HZC2_CROPI